MLVLLQSVLMEPQRPQSVNGTGCVDGASRGVNYTRESQVRKTKEILFNKKACTAEASQLRVSVPTVPKQIEERKKDPAQIKIVVLTAPTEALMETEFMVPPQTIPQNN